MIPAFALDEPTLLRLNSVQSFEDILVAKSPCTWLSGYSPAMWGVLWDYLASEARISAPPIPQWWITKPWELGDVYFFDRHAAQVLKTRIEKLLEKRAVRVPSTTTLFFGYGIELATPQVVQAAEEAGLRFLSELPAHISRGVDWLVVGPLS